ITIILASSSVALVGNLAFLGLMIPHISRFLTGPDYRKIIPVTILMGASLMTLADLVARTINAPFETPVVAILAILGLPFFLIIMRKGVKGWS
ncbi:MAG: iron ABC transporter permease, partial [Bacilli bacterium]|nr:iron ABC transporter permease [Bacilli bacterium]